MSATNLQPTFMKSKLLTFVVCFAFGLWIAPERCAEYVNFGDGWQCEKFCGGRK